MCIPTVFSEKAIKVIIEFSILKYSDPSRVHFKIFLVYIACITKRQDEVVKIKIRHPVYYCALGLKGVGYCE